MCLKRKVRNFVALTRGDTPGCEIYVSERAILELQQKRAWDAIIPGADAKARAKLPKDEQKARELAQWMCANFFDVRTFGAVMSTKGANCGQVRGPVQFAFARLIEPILPLEVSITRMAATTAADADSKGDIRTMGRKHIVPYGLYRGRGYVSAALAGEGGKGTGFSEEDVELLWTALEQMFDHDRSAARGEMTARRLVLFKHDSPSATRLPTSCSKGSRSNGRSTGNSTNQATAAPTTCRRHAPIRITPFTWTPRQCRMAWRSSRESDLDEDGAFRSSERGRAGAYLGAHAHALLPPPMRPHPHRAAVVGEPFHR